MVLEKTIHNKAEYYPYVFQVLNKFYDLSLTNNEIKVLSLLCEKRNELLVGKSKKSKCSDCGKDFGEGKDVCDACESTNITYDIPPEINDMLFSKSIRRSIIADLNMDYYVFNNIVSVLRNSKQLITKNQIHPFFNFLANSKKGVDLTFKVKFTDGSDK